MKTSPFILPRRTFLAGLASTGGLMLAGCSEPAPPTYGNVLRMGDVLTYKAHRLLLPMSSLAKEYDRREITSVPAIGTTDPADPAQGDYTSEAGELYARLRAGGF